MDFSELMNRHAGETIYIIGAGPSLDAFDNTEMGDSPRIVINQMIHNPCVVPVLNDKTYWIYMDSKRKELYPNWRGQTPEGVWEVTPNLIYTAKGTTPSENGSRVIHFGIEVESSKVIPFDRNECKEKCLLYGASGTGVLATHLAWYMGAERIVLVGFDGGIERAKKVEDRYPSAESGVHYLGDSYNRHLDCIGMVLDAKSIEHTFVTGEKDE